MTHTWGWFLTGIVLIALSVALLAPLLIGYVGGLALIVIGVVKTRQLQG